MRDLSLVFPQAVAKRHNSVSVQTLNISILAAIILLSLTYLFTVTSLGTKGYQMKKLEQKLRVLQEDQKQLQIQSSDLQSITRIQIQAQKLNFVPATNITYLKDSDYALK